jgi:hypothetical protein
MPRLLQFCTLFVVLATAALPLRAGPGADVIETLRLSEVVAIMRDEGIAHGASIGETMLGPRGTGTGWTTIVEEIHGQERMLTLLRGGLDAALPAEAGALDQPLDFFASDLGDRILTLEISAREAMLDEAVDEAARDGWEALDAEGGPRADRLRRLAEAGDLIEDNVAGGLNSTFAFYRGLTDSGAGVFDMGLQEMLADVRSQEPEIRAEIESWLFGYLSLAYGPLSDADLDAYIALFETRGGQQLNAALFVAFNAMFERLSEDLGLAAGRMLLGEDL